MHILRVSMLVVLDMTVFSIASCYDCRPVTVQLSIHVCTTLCRPLASKDQELTALMTTAIKQISAENCKSYYRACGYVNERPIDTDAVTALINLFVPGFA
jgi:hypothetical protein